MKKKLLIGILSITIMAGTLSPIVADAAETWNYGYNKSTRQWYSDYYHSSYKHYGSISQKNITFFGQRANKGVWSRLRLNYNGPYAVKYGKHIVR